MFVLKQTATTPLSACNTRASPRPERTATEMKKVEPKRSVPKPAAAKIKKLAAKTVKKAPEKLIVKKGAKLVAVVKRLKAVPAKPVPAKAVPAKPAARSKVSPIYTVKCAKCNKDFKSTNADAVNCPKCAAAIDVKKKVVDTDVPRIECRLIVGDLSVPVDGSSLEHTIGTTEWGPGRPYGPGLIDQWPDAAWVNLLVHLGLPADPLERSVAAAPVKRLVQQLWYEAIKGGVPDAEMFKKRDAARQEEYEEEFVKVKDGAESRSEKAKTNFAKIREARGDSPRTAMAGKQIRVINKAHGARPGTKRQIGLDIIMSTKSVDEALPLLIKAGCNATFITFALKEGFIKLV